METCYVVVEHWNNCEEDEEDFEERWEVAGVFKSRESAVEFIKRMIALHKDFAKIACGAGLHFDEKYITPGDLESEYYGMRIEYPKRMDPFRTGARRHEESGYSIEPRCLFD